MSADNPPRFGRISEMATWTAYRLLGKPWACLATMDETGRVLFYTIDALDNCVLAGSASRLGRKVQTRRHLTRMAEDALELTLRAWYAIEAPASVH